uniref:Uncharacterized protein n=1 Tax=Guillardia theta TaxID=55529 RepID=A0A7S4PR52_GUITH
MQWRNCVERWLSSQCPPPHSPRCPPPPPPPHVSSQAADSSRPKPRIARSANARASASSHFMKSTAAADQRQQMKLAQKRSKYPPTARDKRDMAGKGQERTLTSPDELADADRYGSRTSEEWGSSELMKENVAANRMRVEAAETEACGGGGDRMSPGGANWREEGSGQEGQAGCSHVKRLTKKLLEIVMDEEEHMQDSSQPAPSSSWREMLLVLKRLVDAGVLLQRTPAHA